MSAPWSKGGGEARADCDGSERVDAQPRDMATAPNCQHRPHDVPQNDVGPRDGQPPPAPPPEQSPAHKVKSWGLAPPSTIEVYVDRWTRYFATDPCWLSVYRAAQGEAEPDPAAHLAFCRRLAAAVAPHVVELGDAAEIKSWGPAPPTTQGEYAASWARYVAMSFRRAEAGASAAQPPSAAREPIVTSPPLASPPPAVASPPEDAETPRAPSAAEPSAAPSPVDLDALPIVRAAPASSPPVRRSHVRARRSPPASAAEHSTDEADHSARSVLTTTEAAAYCGYLDASAIRKAHREGRLQPAGRRGGNGPWMWAREELDRYLRGEPPAGTLASDRLSAPLDRGDAHEGEEVGVSLEELARTERGAGHLGEEGGRMLRPRARRRSDDGADVSVTAKLEGVRIPKMAGRGASWRRRAPPGWQLPKTGSRLPRRRRP